MLNLNRSQIAIASALLLCGFGATLYGFGVNEDGHVSQRENRHAGVNVEIDTSAFDRLFEEIDLNADGMLDRYEAADAMMMLVDNADSNDDDAAGKEELLNYFAFLDDERREECAMILDTFDVDGDRQLTRNEVPRQFHMLFGNGGKKVDEPLTVDDLMKVNFDDPWFMFEIEARSIFDEFDADDDGTIVLNDVPPLVREDLREVDGNDDGVLVLAELLEMFRVEARGATFDVADEIAEMSGTIGPTTPSRVLQLVLEHPEVTTIALKDVPGSIDDDSCLRAARMVRQHGFNTTIHADSEVASGGVDFFLAGVKRRVDEGGLVGVHSWGGFEENGNEVARDDPQHQLYLAYYQSMGIPETFYWFTLEAAPASDIHWMTRDEMRQFKLLANDDVDEAVNETTGK